VSRPDKVIFPPPNWTARHSLGVEQDVGPELQQVYELVNNGPSVVSQTMLEVRCPLRAHGHALLYPVEVITVGPINCSSKTTFNALKLKAPERESPTSLKSSAEHNIQRREVIRDPLAEQGNLPSRPKWMTQHYAPVHVRSIPDRLGQSVKSNTYYICGNSVELCSKFGEESRREQYEL
ncbi:hypothetical protein XENORESO_013664, partial [Xenotaenia resolanae]